MIIILCEDVGKLSLSDKRFFIDSKLIYLENIK